MMMRNSLYVVLLFCLALAGLAPAQAQKKLKYPKPEKDQVYDAVEKPALPPGGLEAFGQYLANNQNYPTAALQRGAQGTVVVSFIVEKSGDLTEVAPQQPADPDLDREAVRVVKASGKWTPAMHKGGKVRQRVSIPLSFQIPAGEGGAATAPAAAPSPTPAAALPPAPAATAAPTVVAPDQPARPVGGTEAFFAWIQQNQKYPALARQRKTEGRVIMEFIVQKDGTLTDIKPVKRIGSGCDEEAIRLLKTAPKWLPATYQGQPIKQKMVLPVVFQL